ncbi:MAG: hypothetical protein ACI89R_001202 [Candidatus Azotimanducaceae bacterium]|jgi:hypothetical protein
MKTIFFLISVLLVLNIFSQEIDGNNNFLLPASIYTSSFNKLQSVNNLLRINKKMDLASFEDRSLNVETLEKEIFSIFSKNIGKNSSKFFNEEYQEKAINKSIRSAFFDIDALYDTRRYTSKKD